MAKSSFMRNAFISTLAAVGAMTAANDAMAQSFYSGQCDIPMAQFNQALLAEGQRTIVAGNRVGMRANPNSSTGVDTRALANGITVPIVMFGNLNPSGTLALVSIDGKKIQRLREWTTASTVQYRRPLLGGLDLVLMVSGRRELGGYEDPANNNLMDDVTLYDGSVGLENKRWRFTLSGKNITDETYFNISPGNLSFQTQQNEPRTWRATLGVKY
jgi:outer membrane receptor protein involved in Fe transport